MAPHRPPSRSRKPIPTGCLPRSGMVPRSGHPYRPRRKAVASPTANRVSGIHIGLPRCQKGQGHQMTSGRKLCSHQKHPSSSYESLVRLGADVTKYTEQGRPDRPPLFLSFPCAPQNPQNHDNFRSPRMISLPFSNTSQLSSIYSLN